MSYDYEPKVARNEIYGTEIHYHIRVICPYCHGKLWTTEARDSHGLTNCEHCGATYRYEIKLTKLKPIWEREQKLKRVLAEPTS